MTGLKQEKDERKTKMTLDELAVGKEAKIITVGGEGQLRVRLLDMGLIPQTIVPWAILWRFICGDMS